MNRTIKLDDFLKNHILTNLKIHPNGKFGLYFDNTLDLEGNRYERQVFFIDLDSFESRPLELEVTPDDYYFHGDFVLMKVSSGDKTHFYSYHVAEDKQVLVCEIPFAVKQVGCGDKLYFTASIQNDVASEGTLCSSTSPFYLEGAGVLGQKITALFEADYSGKTIRVITNLDMDLNLLDFDFENNRIAFTAFEVSQQKPIGSKVYTYDVVSEQLQMFTQAEFRIDGLKSMDKDTVFFGGIDLKKYKRNDNQQIHKIDVKTGELVRHGEFIDLSNERPGLVTDSLFTKGGADQRFGNAYYHLRVCEDRQTLCSIDLFGRITFIETGMKMISNFWVMEDQIILLGLKDQDLSELYCFKNDKLTKITNHNAWTKDYKLTKPQALSVDVDGVRVKGWVCPPTGLDQDHEQDEKRPAILLIHGGPKMVYSDIFVFDVQYLCSQGYYVMYANPMGSDGRGDAFAQIRGRFADLPYNQLMSFVDKALESYPGIDADRLGVTGGSYGGYMTNHIITQTGRFKAAVSERCVSSLLTSLTSSDIGYKYAVEYSGCGKSPFSNLEAFIKASPIMNVQHVKTPTLFNHGKDDFRCHYTESLNMYSALCQLGVASRLCLYEGENHGLVTAGKPKSKKKRYEELSSWFDKYLKRG